MSRYKSFFDEDELEEMEVGRNLIDNTCIKCGLNKNCITPDMSVSGEGKKKIYILGEGPNEIEDRKGTQFRGKTGKFLQKKLAEYGIDLHIDCWKDNAVRCRSHDNNEDRKPTKNEISCCKDRIDASIKELKPDFIWLFGKVALESFYFKRFSDLDIKDWRGLCIPDKKTGAYIVPMYPLSYPLKNENDNVINGIYDKDIKFAVDCLSKPSFTCENYLDFVFPLKKYNDVVDILDLILTEKPEYFFFDYETTSLKPYNKGHKIACISGSDNKDYAFSFVYDHIRYPWKEKQFKTITELWTKILLNPEITKVAQNCKFEDTWSRIIFNIERIVNLNYCTMNSSHIIASQRPTNLKWQSYINFGIEDYSKTIKPFLENSDSKGFNKVMDAPIDELLLYSSIDSLALNWLFHEQLEFFKKNPKREKMRKLFQKGLHLFADMEIRGINTNKEIYSKNYSLLTEELGKKEDQLRNFKEVVLFQDKYRKTIDFESSHDLRKLFFTIMNLKSTKKTSTGTMESTDKSVLAEIDHPIAKILLEKRKIKKQIDYVNLFLREINDDGRIRPFWNLHIPVTGRSSSDSPNWQNIPKRDKEAEKRIREGIIPTKGRKILEWDFASIEVRTAAMYTKDPVLMNYIQTGGDMHEDQAIDLFMLPKEEVEKMIRFHAKNGFVFPEFYGSYYKSTASTLWLEVPKLKLKTGRSLKDHLHSKGIKIYQDFEKHVEKVEKIFWKKFKVFKEWQLKSFNEFAKTGTIETFFGFGMSGFLSKNEIINYRFQATAFHCLLWSIVQLDNEIKQKKLKSEIIGQVHDCCLIDLLPEEEEEIIYLSKEISTQRIKNIFSWVNVPLEIELEITEKDETWFNKKIIKNK